ncbi:MAG: MerR family transcriptional regulator [Rhodospirillales bacterium]|nr:MerR family transcriptional regulator [Rhodospirillales bacterium]
MMPNDTERFSLDELCSLADLPRRTVRFYIQEGLVDRPEGAKRGAYYTRGHLEQLLTIRKWQRAGLNLERIRELVSAPEEGGVVPPERPRRPGDVSVRSHIMLRPGVELVIEPREAGLAPEEVRSLARQAAVLLNKLKKETS